MGNPAKLLLCVLDMQNDKTADKDLTSLNEQLALGYEIYGEPVKLTGERVLYSLLMPTVADKIYGDTAYPTDRQLGYIRWAFNMQDFDVTACSLTKRECSDLITYHKDELGGTQSMKSKMQRKLRDLRGKPEEPVKEAEPAPGEYDDDIPF